MDNAGGVTAVLVIGRFLMQNPPKRSVILALWDSEKRGLIGSRYFANNPLVDLGLLVVNVNLDILGANLAPSLSSMSYIFGSELGGYQLKNAVKKAIHGECLDMLSLSVGLAQDRGVTMSCRMQTMHVIIRQETRLATWIQKRYGNKQELP